MHHEELLWKQKAICDWLKFGNRNTKFFHTRTLQRRKNNRVTTIHNSRRVWIYDPESIEAEANDFFQKIYGEDLGPMGSLPPSNFPHLDSTDIDFWENKPRMMKLRMLYLTWHNLKH